MRSPNTSQSIALMTLRIHKSANENGVLLALSGRIDVDQVTELERLLKSEADLHSIVLDLKEVRLVSREAVRFLKRCEGDGIKLENCPAYIREWVERETVRPKEFKQRKRR